MRDMARDATGRPRRGLRADWTLSQRSQTERADYRVPNAAHCVPRPRRPQLAARSLALARSHAVTVDGSHRTARSRAPRGLRRRSRDRLRVGLGPHVERDAGEAGRLVHRHPTHGRRHPRGRVRRLAHRQALHSQGRLPGRRDRPGGGGPGTAADQPRAPSHQNLRSRTRAVSPGPGPSRPSWRRPSA